MRKAGAAAGPPRAVSSYVLTPEPERWLQTGGRGGGAERTPFPSTKYRPWRVENLSLGTSLPPQQVAGAPVAARELEGTGPGTPPTADSEVFRGGSANFSGCVVARIARRR